MKFRVVVRNYESIHHVLRSLMASAKLSSNLVFRISPTNLELIADSSYKNGPLLSRCEFQSSLFHDYSFSGISNYNLILFDVRCDSLLQILHSLQTNIKSLKIKLTNGRDGRFLLAIVVEYPSLESSRIINHYLYITLIHRKFWSLFEPKFITPVHISFVLPHFKHILSPTIERLAPLSQYAVVSCRVQDNNKAYFAIGLCNDSVSIKSKFSNLEQSDNLNVIPFEEDTALKVRIDIRKLNLVFNALSTTKPNQIFCNITNETAVCFKFKHEFSCFYITLPNNES